MRIAPDRAQEGQGDRLHELKQVVVDFLVAVPARPYPTKADIEFLTGNTATPVPARNILSFDELSQIALHFLATGERSELVSWEPV